MLRRVCTGQVANCSSSPGRIDVVVDFDFFAQKKVNFLGFERSNTDHMECSLTPGGRCIAVPEPEEHTKVLE